MDTVIREINESLLKILSDLEKRQLASQNDLDAVNTKINEKVDEAKEYKIEVDNAKGKIKSIEKEIESFEVDLTDLNERFGNKDFNGILEIGNREINSKIMEKQNEITKHRQKIGELTERARSIKELLINLKKDKSLKEEKLDIITKTYDYYSDSLNKIIEFAKNNPDSLNSYDVNYNSLNYDYINEPLTKVFDEIESMDIDEVEEENKKIKEKLIDTEEEEPLNNIFENIQNKKFDFDEINSSIDEEYSNIFGNAKEINIEDIKNDESLDENHFEFTENSFNNQDINQEINIFDVNEIDEGLLIEENKEEPKNIFTVEETSELEPKQDLEIPDIFGNDYGEENNNKTTEEIEETFKEFDLDFNKFNNEDQELIKNIFSKDHFQKVLGILRNNQLDLNKIYDSISVLEQASPEEMDQTITKLLLANQTKNNIELVLNNLGNIKNNYLTEVINSYEGKIKDANIVDIVMKTKKISGDIDITNKPMYLTDMDFTEDEITILESTINRDIWEKVITFPEIITVNYRLLKDIGVGNIKDIFKDHPQMFIINPDKFKAIFSKYDQDDLIRCLEKNASVIEKL